MTFRDNPADSPAPWSQMHRPGAFLADLVSADEARHLAHRAGAPEPAAAAVAGRQLTVITAEQLALVGLGRRAIAGRLRRGIVTRLWRGVFLWGAPPAPPGALELAGCLACGPGAVASHDSAASLWALVSPPTGVAVTVPARNCRSRAGLAVHRTTALAASDVSDVRGIPVTSVARTVIDYAASQPGDELERVISDVFARRLASERELLACLERSPHRAGVAATRAVLAPGPQVTRSEGERVLRRLIRDAGLPVARHNVRVEGKVVDALWPQAGLILEVDGYDVHGHRRAFERDRARDQRLLAAGYRVMRATWRQLTERPLLVAANLASALRMPR